LTDITLVIDRSGSMESVRTDAEGGIAAFVEEQRELPGQALLTLVHFDTVYEVVHDGVPISDVPRYTLVPRGSTALLDAIGRGIEQTGRRLAAMPEAERPGLVVFVIVTDGQENSSREFSRDRIRRMIEHQQAVYSWKFTFLGANQDAFAEAGALGVGMASSSPVAAHKLGEAYRVSSRKLARMRAQQAAGESVVDAFTDEERKRVTE
jgi:hypothetical protein